MPSGNVKVTHEPYYDTWKVSWNGALNYMVTSQVVEQAHYFGEHQTVKIMQRIAQDMAKTIEKDIFESLLASSMAPDSVKGMTYAQAKHASMKALYEQQANPKTYSSPDWTSGSWNDPAVDALGSLQVAADTIKNGSATVSLTYEPAYKTGDVLGTLKKAIPGLKNARANCPASKTCGSEVYHDMPVTEVIIHLNDTHKWTREKIADWLETLDVDLSFQEPAEPPENPCEEVADKSISLMTMDEYDHKLDAMKYALMNAPILKPEDAFKMINPS